MSVAPSAKRLLIVDDHPVVRRGIRDVIETFTAPGIEVIGEVGSGEMAVAEVQALQPDIVIMDIHLPGIDGLKATQLIKEKMPKVQVVLLSTNDEPEYRKASVELGAAGFITKDKVVLDMVPLLQNLRVEKVGD